MKTKLFKRLKFNACKIRTVIQPVKILVEGFKNHARIRTLDRILTSI